MSNQKIKSANILLVVLLMMASLFSLFLLSGCNQGFDSATKLNVNSTTTSATDAKYTSIKANATEDVFVCWTISNTAKDNASFYTLVVLDEQNKALNDKNNLTSVTIYDKDQKSLGTATTTTQGQYNLSAVLGDQKIAGGTYYAVLKFSVDGTYNIAIQLNE